MKKNLKCIKYNHTKNCGLKMKYEEISKYIKITHTKNCGLKIKYENI